MPARPDAAGSSARLVSEANGGVTASIGTTSTTRRRRRQASLGVRSHTASKYGVAVVFVGVAATLNGAAPHTFGLPSPFLLYYPPLLAAALLGGLGPGVLATLLGALSTLYFNVEPVHSFKWGGPADALRLPTPHLPAGLKLDRNEGAGEVQTPLHGADLRIGDRVYFRHAKAGELCERFDTLLLVEGDRVVDEVPTYRGEGRTFL